MAEKLSDWYDYPEYYDLAFVNDTKPEADFLEQIWNKYSEVQPIKRVLEPACGSGRQVVELAARGYEVVGLDLSERSVDYAKTKLKRRKLNADVFVGDMTNFKLPEPVDAAFCMINTFRHLTTDEMAYNHLQCVADALKPGGLYILAFHLIPHGVEESCIERWRGEKGKTKVTFTLTFDQMNRRKRVEKMSISMLARTPKGPIRCRAEYPMRLYTAKQWQELYEQVTDLELIEIFDFEYDLDITRELDKELADAVFVFRKKATKTRKKKAAVAK